MATHTKSVKRILSEVRQEIPNAGETSVIEKINDAIVLSGKFNTKFETAKADLTTDKRRYTLSDTDSGIEVNKLYKVSIMDGNGDYIKIPRMTAATVSREDIT